MRDHRPSARGTDACDLAVGAVGDDRLTEPKPPDAVPSHQLSAGRPRSVWTCRSHSHVPAAETDAEQLPAREPASDGRLRGLGGAGDAGVGACGGVRTSVMNGTKAGESMTVTSSP